MGPIVRGGSEDAEQQMDARDKNGPGKSVGLGKALTLEV